ncbi:hypothetical protein OJ253_2436 [Cryptosporidium canis]|uniref:AP2/ERF domain-containing protein n=1 Tax=Cryptosporidium canis TaxID=195482 RepID=A0A9D5DHL4_9CRYT|nr:hypothetical protein OJ253_2436 [Cryptosporidium canis]
MPEEERKNRCTLKLPIGNEEDENEMMDFLDIDEEELVHDVKQAVSPTSSRSLENPDFSGINLLLSSTGPTNGGGTIEASASSGQFFPYFGQPLLFPNSNQNLFNLVALCFSTPPPFSGIPQNNPFFSSNGINEHVNFVPFSAAAPLFYFGLPDENSMGGAGGSHLPKYPHQGQPGKGGLFGGQPGLSYPGSGTFQDLEGGAYVGGGVPAENEVQYNSARLRPNLAPVQSPGFPNCPGNYVDGVYGCGGGSGSFDLSKSTKLSPSGPAGLSSGLHTGNSSNIGYGGVGYGAVPGQGAGLCCSGMPFERDYGVGGGLGGKGVGELPVKGRGQGQDQGQSHLYYEQLGKKHYHQGSGSKRQSMSLSGSGNDCGEQSANSGPVNSGTVTEKKNRWQLSDPQFKSGYKGVSWNSRMEAWLAFFVENGVRKSKTFSSRKFGFNRAREKAIKYLDARRKGIILTTPPPLSPSKGMYDRIPQQRKIEPTQDNNYSPGLHSFPAFSNDMSHHGGNSNGGGSLAIACNSSSDSVNPNASAVMAPSSNGALLESSQTVMCS